MELRFTSKYSVDNDIIDGQHKKLFAIVNGLSKAISEGEGLNVIEKVLEEMSEYALLHFTTEEELLFNSDYEELSKHKALHDQFKKEIMHVTRNVILNKSMEQVIEVHKFLYSWLGEHILEEDAKYCDDIR